MDIKRTLLDKLSEKYPNVKFKFKDDTVFSYYLVYKAVDTVSYMQYDSTQFTDELDDFCSKYLTEKELEELVIVYDYLDEIK